MSLLRYLKKTIPSDFFLRTWYHRVMGFLSALCYLFPARNMIVIAVTGTDGKTTTCNLIYSILRESGIHVGMASTINFAIGEKKWTNHTHKTTLGRFYLQKLLARMRKEKVTHLVLEVSSHALEQGRIFGIPISLAILTNISREHLDFHKTIKRYTQTKMKLFSLLTKTKKIENIPKTIIGNYEDESFSYLQKLPCDKLIGCGFHEKQSYDNCFFPKKIETHKTMSLFFLNLYGKEEEIHLSLPGRYNIMNAMMATKAAEVLHIPSDNIKTAFSKQETIPGRFEIVSDQNTPFTVIIDYAVTENALKKLFSSAKNIMKKDSRLILVFGACGDRDKEKRPLLGEVASTHCNICIVTDEEPYTEDPTCIRKMILSGIDNEKTKCYEIPDRKEALQKAFSLAKAGDIVLATGLGDQTSRIFGEKHLPWNEREVIQNLLKGISNLTR